MSGDKTDCEGEVAIHYSLAIDCEPLLHSSLPSKLRTVASSNTKRIVKCVLLVLEVGGVPEIL